MYVHLDLPDGAVVTVEAVNLGGPTKAGVLDKFDAKELFSSVRSVGVALKDAVADSNATRISVQFGVSAALESGTLVALLCKGEAAADFRVELEWTRSVEE